MVSEDTMPRAFWPKFLRGDCNFGTGGVMTAAEESDLPYLFKLKSTKNVKHLAAVTSRPLLLHAVGKQSTHTGQTMINISSTHGQMKKVQRLLNRIVTFFQLLK